MWLAGEVGRDHRVQVFLLVSFHTQCFEGIFLSLHRIQASQRDPLPCLMPQRKCPYGRGNESPPGVRVNGRLRSVFLRHAFFDASFRVMRGHSWVRMEANIIAKTNSTARSTDWRGNIRSLIVPAWSNIVDDYLHCILVKIELTPGVSSRGEAYLAYC